jgi:hypothetical protein
MASPITVSKRIVIAGGNLKDDCFWVPKCIHMVEDTDFAELYAKDIMFAKFCGLDNFFGNAMLDHLRELRNKVIDLEILKILKDDDPMYQATTLPKRARMTIDQARLPQYVELDLPSVSFNGETAPAMRIKCLTDTFSLRVVSIELSTSVLSYIRIAAQAVQANDGNCVLVLDAPAKRNRRTDRVETSCKQITPDYRRQSLYVTYSTDGRSRKHYMKPRAWEQCAIDETCAKLMTWLEGLRVPGEGPPDAEEVVDHDALHEDEAHQELVDDAVSDEAGEALVNADSEDGEVSPAAIE